MHIFMNVFPETLGKGYRDLCERGIGNILEKLREGDKKAYGFLIWLDLQDTVWIEKVLF